MRRYILTPLLAVTALVAAWLAPRLFAAPAPVPEVIEAVPAPLPPVEVVVKPAPLPEVFPVAPPVEPPPPPAPPPALALPELTEAPPRPTSPDLLIPELDEPLPPVRVVEPEPEVPDHFWDNCPACGMG